MSQVASSLWSLWIKSTTSPGEDEKNPLHLVASPGLMTLLDVALYRSNEGGLTSNVCAANALLYAWVDLKQQARALLQILLHTENLISTNKYGNSSGSSSVAQQQERRAMEFAESFARVCLEASSDALERLATDKLSQSASSMSESNNINNANDDGMNLSSTTSSGSSLLGVGSQDIAHGVAESIRTAETGRRSVPGQTYYKKECWESPLLFCPEYSWADDVLSSCQRLLRGLNKHEFYSGMIMESLAAGTVAPPGGGGLSTACEREARLLVDLVHDDLP